jgi:hypothetical protein
MGEKKVKVMKIMTVWARTMTVDGDRKIAFIKFQPLNG